jgi:hypothetical protein
MTDGRLGKTNLPAGMQVPEPVSQVKVKTEDTSQIEHAMAAAVSKIKAIDSLSLEKAIK